MIDVEKWESVRGGYYREGKSVRTLMRETGHSFRTIRRIIEGNEPGRYVLKAGRRAPVLGEYKAQIDEMVAANASLPRKQRYTASRIYQLVQAKGFAGAESTVRHYVSRVRKKQHPPTVYLPLSFAPGQDGQADWGEAEVMLKGECVTVQLFVMRLNYSRRIFVMAFPSQKQEAFFQGHVAAFHHFAGVPWRLTYDNLTTAVQKVLKGKARQEQTKFLAFRGQYLFDSHFCTPGEGHEKGGVEHGVGYVRRQYLVPRPVVESYAELNAYLRERCVADDVRQVKGQAAAIGVMWQQEQPHLRPLPAYDYDCCRVVEAALTPYSQVIVETNRYSVPVAAACARLVVKLYPFEVEIYGADQAEAVAVHERCYAREQDIFDPLHYLPLVEQRPGAFDYATPLPQWRTTWPPVYETLLTHLRQQWPEGRGIREFVTILQLHQQHSMEQIAEAIRQALHHQCAHAAPSGHPVQLCLNQQLTPALPAMTLDLQSRPQLLGIGEQVVNLAQYDALVGGVPCP